MSRQEQRRELIKLILLRTAEITLLAAFVWWCLKVSAEQQEN